MAARQVLANMRKSSRQKGDRTGPRPKARFDSSVLDIDPANVARDIEEGIRRSVKDLRRRGAVVAVSGGVDSAVCAVLSARALGEGRVFGLLLPERDFSPEGTARGETVCKAAGIDYDVTDISPALEALACYRHRDEAAAKLVPDYDSTWRMKIAVADDLMKRDRLNYFNLIVESPAGVQQKKRMPLNVYLQVVAATNMKQRTRKLLEYFHAERLNYAVIGTPNRLEYELGFFVRGGDGLADVKPIAHLYKTQVYALAAYLGVPDDIRDQPPSTDTYSLPQTQEEFYFAVPYEQMDLLLNASAHDVPADEAAAALGLTAEQVDRVFRDIAAKRRAAERLHRPAIMMEDPETQ